MTNLFSQINYKPVLDLLNKKLKETNKKVLETLNSLPVSTRKNITKSFKTLNKIHNKRKKKKKNN